MKSFLLKILAFFLVFFVLEKVFFLVMKKDVARQYDKRLEMVLTGNMNKDLIVIGSSRATGGVLAGEIEDSTGLSTYNLAYVGSNIQFHEFIVRSLLKHNEAPQAVVLVVDDPVELWEHDKSVFRYDCMYPLVYFDQVTNELVDRGQKSVLAKYFALVRIYHRNFFPPEFKVGSLDTLRRNGSQPLSFYKEFRDWRYIWEYEQEKEVSEKRKALLDLSKQCKAHGVQLIVAYPPNFKVHNKGFENRMRDLLDPDALHMIYDTTNPIYKDRSLYHDADHLHIKGAKAFTKDLIAYFRSLGLKSKYPPYPSKPN